MSQPGNCAWHPCGQPVFAVGWVIPVVGRKVARTVGVVVLAGCVVCVATVGAVVGCGIGVFVATDLVGTAVSVKRGANVGDAVNLGMGV